RGILTGNTLPFSTRAVPHPKFVFPLTFSTGTTETVYLHLKPVPNNPFSLAIWDAESFIHREPVRQLLNGLIYGLLLILGLYHGMFALSARDPTYAYFSVFAFLILFFLGARTAQAFEYLWPNLPSWQERAPWALANTALVALIFFSRPFLRLPSMAQRTDRWLIACMVGCTAFIGIIALLRVPRFLPAILAIWLIAGLGLLMAAANEQNKAQFAPARTYMIGVGFLIFGIVFHSLTAVDAWAVNFVSLASLKISVSLGIVFLSLALMEDNEGSHRREVAQLSNQVQLAQQAHSRNRQLEERIEELAEAYDERAVTIAHLSRDLETTRSSAISSRLHYRTLLEDSPDPIFVIDSDDGRVLDVNSRAEELMGLPREDILGRNQRKLYPATRADSYAQALAEHRESGEPLLSPVEIERADGTAVPVEVTPCLLKLEGRNVVIAVIRDLSSISAHRVDSTGDALHFAQTVADHAGIWVSVFDRALNPLIWNRMAVELSGFSQEEVRRVGWSLIYQRLFPDPEYRDSLRCRVEQPAAAKNGVRNLETEIVTPNGEVRHMLWNMHALPKWPDGTSGHALFGVDTTTEHSGRGDPARSAPNAEQNQGEKERAEAELLRLEKVHRVLLADSAREILYRLETAVSEMRDARSGMAAGATENERMRLWVKFLSRIDRIRRSLAEILRGAGTPSTSPDQSPLVEPK
ncbi:MAG: 7TM diverse intracellular signaling domain-containing protein, partial [Acidobacteriota bacterium]